MSNAVITIAALAATAAITAGLLMLAGVGGGQTREERINRLAEELVADVLRESPQFCDSWTGAIGLDVIAGDSELSHADQRVLAGRVATEVQEQCRERRR